ncbi:hypothetical protein AVEN_269874-1 [Araneus ventricosus]|uniref:Uncharacterized protein n=1 Tax=Araneus ventricosus TaxID=182803 RepID=A0A4Y2CG88_ARAVE|nr:hypothetical protein AVEN_269874-1 [Araneus ventricosus]
MIAVQLPPIEYFPKTTASQDILEEISPLPSSSNKDRKRKKPVQVKKIKIDYTSNVQRRLENESKNGTKICRREKEAKRLTASSVPKPLKKTGISFGFVKPGLTKIAPILKETTRFMNVMFILPKKKCNRRMYLSLKRIFKFSKADHFLIFLIYTSFLSYESFRSQCG